MDSQKEQDVAKAMYDSLVGTIASRAPKDSTPHQAIEAWYNTGSNADEVKTLQKVVGELKRTHNGDFTIYAHMTYKDADLMNLALIIKNDVAQAMDKLATAA